VGEISRQDEQISLRRAGFVGGWLGAQQRQA